MLFLRLILTFGSSFRINLITQRSVFFNSPGAFSHEKWLKFAPGELENADLCVLELIQKHVIVWQTEQNCHMTNY